MDDDKLTLFDRPAPEVVDVPVVLDAAEGRRRAEEGQARSEANRDQLREQLDTAVRAAAVKHFTFTADQVWVELGAVPDTRGAASALGPAMKRGVRDGLMVPTGRFRLSERPVAHRKPLPEYRSLTTGGST